MPAFEVTSQTIDREDFRLGPWLVQPSLQRLLGKDGAKPLGPTVLGTLLCLARRPGQAVSKDELVATAWQGDAASDEALTTAIYELRKALEDDARRPRYIATIRGRGYRLMMTPERPSPVAARGDRRPGPEKPPAHHTAAHHTPAPTAPAPTVQPRRHPRGHRPGMQIAAPAVAAATAVLVALLSILATSPGDPDPLSTPPTDSIGGSLAPPAGSSPAAGHQVLAGPPDAAPETGVAQFSELPPIRIETPEQQPAEIRRSVKVMPLEPRGGDPLDFARGLSEHLAIDLARSDWLEVVPAFSAAGGAARTSGEVDAVVEGAVRRQGDRVLVTVQLVAAEDGQLLWGGTWERSSHDIVTLERWLAAEISRRVRGRLGAAAVIALHPEVDEALRLGRHFLDGATPDKARQFFTFAVERQPTLATAHAGLAETYLAEADGLPASSREAAVDEARRSATTALEIDADLPAAHASIAAIAFLHDGNWRTAAEHFEKAGLGSGAPVSSVRRYAAFLSAAGRHEQAITLLGDAVRRAPASIDGRLDLARANYLAGRFDAALGELETLSRLAPADPRPARLETDILLVSGDLAAAVAACRRAFELAGGPREIASTLDQVFDRAGLEGVIRCLQGAGFEVDGGGAHGMLFDPLRLARFEAAQGNTESAIRQLQAARDEAAPDLVWLTVDPAFEGLRAEPGFQRLVASLSLPDLT